MEYETITYQSGFKYQLLSDSTVQTGILGYSVDEDYYQLFVDGTLTAKKGYSWDGASCCPDFKSIMRGSMSHDVVYQMIRLKQIDRSLRKVADRLLEQLCIEDGMWQVFAAIVYKAVRVFGKEAAHPNNKRQELTAP